MNLLGVRLDARAALGPLALALLWTGGLIAQSPPSDDLTDADKTIESLRQVSRELPAAVRLFHSHIDEAVASYDRGYRLYADRQVQGADAGVAGGPADIMQGAVRKFAAFRMLAARSETYQPAPVVDMDRIQNLIAEAHVRVDASTSMLRRLLVVSVKDIDPHRNAEVKVRHDQLLKARAAAEEAAKQAWLALPIDIPEADSSEESSQKAWDLLSRGWSNGVRTAQTAPASAELKDRSSSLPIRIQRRRRVTLVSEASYRMALTDAGIDDENGRRLFYQEEWIQRGTSVIRLRWRVAVDTASGQHVLIKRYPALELPGSLDGIYPSMDRYSLWYMEPADESAPAEVEAALADVEDARLALLMAVDDFQNTNRASLAVHDRGRAKARDPLLDAGLAGSIRETLFAIRAHLAGVPASLEAESKVWRAITEARQTVVNLECLAAWGNRVNADAVDWEHLLERSEREIDLVRAAEIAASASVPPDSSQAEAEFPALQRGVIVRIRRPAEQSAQNGMILCRQEIWHMESPMPGSREVRRTATLVAVDPRTGAQNAVAGKTKYYPAESSDVLEQIFDEHAADDLPVGAY